MLYHGRTFGLVMLVSPYLSSPIAKTVTRESFCFQVGYLLTALSYNGKTRTNAKLDDKTPHLRC